MAGVAQVWLTEDELDFLVKSLVRFVQPPLKNPDAKDLDGADEHRRQRQALLDKLRPLAYGVSCKVSSEGGAQCNVGELTGEPVPLGACEGDLLTELK